MISNLVNKVSIITRKKHHVVISGTGRAGTTFLIQLLTHLGMDTGFHRESKINQHCNAGLELNIRSESAPYIVKDPRFCEYADDILKNPLIILDHVIIPIRDIPSAAASRIRVVEDHPPSELKGSDIDGGLWGTNNPKEQEVILQEKLTSLLLALADSHTPVTIMNFPRLVNDARYTYHKLSPLLKGVGFKKFQKSFGVVSRPELVHDFTSSSEDRDKNL